MTTSRNQRLLAKIQSAMECSWLAVSTVGWMIAYFFQTFQMHYFKWRLARGVKQHDAAKLQLEFERVRKFTS